MPTPTVGLLSVGAPEAVMRGTCVFLQNAWSPVYAGQHWPRQSWLRALERSRSGQRLRLLIDNLAEVWNTTAEVADHPDGCLPANDRHVRKVLRDVDPAIVVACGRQAEEVLRRLWLGPLLVVPHPAARLLTNELYLAGRELLDKGLTARVALRLAKEGYVREQLPDFKLPRTKPKRKKRTCSV